MAIRSFKQIMDAHEAAHAMLRSLEVDVRDTLADAKAELERFRVAKPADVGDWAPGSTFVALRDDGPDVKKGTIYTLSENTSDTRYAYHLGFVDDSGDFRVFYDFWLAGIKRLT